MLMKPASEPVTSYEADAMPAPMMPIATVKLLPTPSQIATIARPPDQDGVSRQHLGGERAGGLLQARGEEAADEAVDSYGSERHDECDNELADQGHVGLNDCHGSRLSLQCAGISHSPGVLWPCPSWRCRCTASRAARTPSTEVHRFR